MKILIGVDDSPHSHAAVEFVRRMAWPQESSILVLSVVRPMVGVYAEAYVPAAPYVEEMSGDLVRFHQERVTVRRTNIDLQGVAMRCARLWPRLFAGDLEIKIGPVKRDHPRPLRPL